MSRIPLSDYHRRFLYGACFAEFAVIVIVASRFFEKQYSVAVYLSYVASIFIFLQGLVRYVITVSVYQSEKTAPAMCTTWFMVLVGACTVIACLYGPVWFGFVALLCLLGSFKSKQAKGSIGAINMMEETEKVFHSRIQDGLISVQVMLALAMLMFGIAGGTKAGDYLARYGFGVCDLSKWRTSAFIMGALFCLVVMAYLGVRIFIWHRGDLERAWS